MTTLILEPGRPLQLLPSMPDNKLFTPARISVTSMYFEDFASFIAMGKHGIYVWSAYGVALSVIVYNIVAPWLAKKRLVPQLRQQINQQAAQRRHEPGNSAINE